MTESKKTGIKKFSDMALAPEILSAISDVGYETPTDIQAQAIPVILTGRDVLGIAQTGTGKTASFTLPVLHKLMQGRSRARMPRTLILEPTRELAAQVADNFDLYGKNTKLSQVLLIGGVPFADQERGIERGADVIIATPGRLLDHFERGKIMLRGIEILVIDEADRMLDMGFIPDIERIVKLLPFTRQTLFFSATMPSEITALSEKFLQAPQRIEVAPPSSTSKNIKQYLVETETRQKREVLRHLFAQEEVKNAIIFCNRKRDIGTLQRSLERHGFRASALHGDMEQRLRLKTLDMFKNGEVTFLIASDVAARGLDIPAVSHVFNFDVPTHAEDYVHRTGRTGRAGRSGRAFTIATPSDAKYVAGIEQLTGQTIERLNPFSNQDNQQAKVAEKQKKQPQSPARKSQNEQSPGKEKKRSRAEASTSKQAPSAKGFGQDLPAFMEIDLPS